MISPFHNAGWRLTTEFLSSNAIETQAGMGCHVHFYEGERFHQLEQFHIVGNYQVQPSKILNEEQNLLWPEHWRISMFIWFIWLVSDHALYISRGQISTASPSSGTSCITRIWDQPETCSNWLGVSLVNHLHLNLPGWIVPSGKNLFETKQQLELQRWREGWLHLAVYGNHPSFWGPLVRHVHTFSIYHFASGIE